MKRLCLCAHHVPVRPGAPRAPASVYLGWCGGLESSNSWAHNDPSHLIPRISEPVRRGAPHAPASASFLAEMSVSSP